jgi:hypothetical protein
VNRPGLVVPLGRTGASGESEVGSVAADLARLQREQPVRGAPSRVRGPARETLNHRAVTAEVDVQPSLPHRLHARTYSRRSAVAVNLVSQHVVDDERLAHRHGWKLISLRDRPTSGSMHRSAGMSTPADADALHDEHGDQDAQGVWAAPPGFAGSRPRVLTATTGLCSSVKGIACQSGRLRWHRCSAPRRPAPLRMSGRRRTGSRRDRWPPARRRFATSCQRCQRPRGVELDRRDRR